MQHCLEIANQCRAGGRPDRPEARRV